LITLLKLAIISAKKGDYMSKVLLPLAKGFEEVEAVSLIDVMRRGGIEVTVAYLDSELVLGANGIVVKGDISIDEVNANEV